MKPALLKAEIPPEYSDLGEIYIRRFRYREQLEWEQAHKEDSLSKIPAAVSLVCIKEDGSPRFTKEEAEELDTPLLMSLWFQLLPFNLIENKDIDNLKNSYRQEAPGDNSLTQPEN